MNVFLISTNVTTSPYAVYPLGMAVIAEALIRQGHRVCQHDMLAEQRSIARLKDRLRRFSPDFVGFSIRNIDNVDSFTSDREWYLSGARELIRVVRDIVDAPVVVGGPSFSIMPREIFSYLEADFGIVGEGEQAFGELIAAVSRGDHPPPIIHPGPHPLRGREIGSGHRSEKLAKFYLEQSGMINLQTKRGCPHRCRYCTYPSLEGRRFRYRDTGEVVEDIIALQRRFETTTFAFADSVFNDAADRYLEVAEKIISGGVKINWSGFFRPRGIGRKALRLLKRSGLYAVELGTDAASDATLEGLEKGFDFRDVVSANAACAAEEIPAAHFIMFGGPGESEQTIEEGLRNIARLEKSVVFAFSGIRILPDTGIHRHAIREGTISDHTPLLKPRYYYSPNVDPGEMNRTIAAAFKGHRTRIFPPGEAQFRLEAMKRFGFRGLLWDRLIRY